MACLLEKYMGKHAVTAFQPTRMPFRGICSSFSRTMRISHNISDNTGHKSTFAAAAGVFVNNSMRSTFENHNTWGHSITRYFSMDPESASASAEYTEEYSSKKKTKPDVSIQSKIRMPFTAPSSAVDDSLPAKSNSASPDIEWSKLGLSLEIAQLLVAPTEEGGLGFRDGPTPVQKMAIPAILTGSATQIASNFSGDKIMKSIAFAAATGSGKTLAYLLPIAQALKAQEVLLQSTSQPLEPGSDNETSDPMTRKFRKPRRPRAIILAPTRELTVQIASVLKSLSHTIKLSTASIVGGEDLGKQRKRLNKPIDIVVSTPGRLIKLWDDGSLFLGDVKFIVIDEVDTMLEQGFQDDIGKIMHPLLYKHKGAFDTNKVNIDSIDVVPGSPQVIMTSATMTNAVRRLLRDESVPMKKSYKRQVPTHNGGQESSSMVKILLPKNMRVLTAPGLHRVVPRLRQVFIDVGNSDKLSLLIDLVAGSGGAGSALTSADKGKRGSSDGLTLVFCNTVSSCRAVQHALTESGIDSLSYHGEMNSIARAKNLELFRQAGKGGSREVEETESYELDDFESDFDDFDAAPRQAAVSSTIKNQIPKVMICTDIAARGLDVPEVDHVIMFDFPLNPIDYLHRAGRTARGINQQDKISGGAGRAGSGRVSALVAKRDRVLAMAIEGAVQRGEPLDGLSSRKTDYLPGSALEKNYKSSTRSVDRTGRPGRTADRARPSKGGRGSKGRKTSR